MSHLRWNPLQGTYTMVAANRQNRPHLPKDFCPFCPGSGKVPDDYEVFIYPNDFPVLSTAPETVSSQDELYKQAEAYGNCEVILYSPDHYKGLSQLTVEHITKLVTTWAERYTKFSADQRVKYVYPFENRGEEVGVTMPHPHGQLYAYPFIPHKIEIELNNTQQHFKQHGASMFQDILDRELKDGKRVIFQNDSFVAFVPWFTDYPYGVYVFPKDQQLNHNLQHMSAQVHADLAETLKQVTGAFDTLFNKPFPYMKCLFQAPVNSPQYIDAEQWYPFHIKFFTPLRAADKIKWLASSETGAGAAANPMLVEEGAAQLRQALQQFNNFAG